MAKLKVDWTTFLLTLIVLAIAGFSYWAVTDISEVSYFDIRLNGSSQ